ncbi:MAG: transcription antitermination factor NusB [Holosporales bacterium]|nr:transcription antitermination factor NusB [Holosporales bacterium]
MAQKIISKHISRFAVVQTLYQMEIVGTSFPDTIDNFVEHYIKKEPEYTNISLKFFKKLIDNFQKNTDFDKLIDGSLKEGKNLSNIPIIGYCTIKAAVFEMLFENTDTPVIINEYIEIAKKFLDKSMVRFINALLDKISKQIEENAR